MSKSKPAVGGKARKRRTSSNGDGGSSSPDNTNMVDQGLEGKNRTEKAGEKVLQTFRYELVQSCVRILFPKSNYSTRATCSPGTCYYSIDFVKTFKIQVALKENFQYRLAPRPLLVCT